jgi:tetratricopeptide (TPR) repeat protein
VNTLMSDRIQKLAAMIEADPRDGFCLYALAQEYGKLGRHADAIVHYQLAIDVDPGLFYAYFHMARSQEELGDAAAAVASLTEGLARAKVAGDAKAAGELASYLDQLT